MYYVETRADNSGYTNHRVICLVVIGSSFDSEQVFPSFKWIPSIVFEKWTLIKNLTDPDADAGVTTIARLFSSKSQAKNQKCAYDPLAKYKDTYRNNVSRKQRLCPFIFDLRSTY